MLPGSLASAGIDPLVGRRLAVASLPVSQVQAAVAAGSHAACTFGFHEVLAVGGTIALAGGVPGVFIPAR